MNLMGFFDRMKSSNLGNLIFGEEGVKKGYLRVSGTELSEVCYGEPPSDVVKGLVLPSFVNSHTHIGDSFAYPAPRLPLEVLVGPANSYKHRALSKATSETKADGMAESLEVMARSGITLFSDFREEGPEGVMMIKRLLRPEHPKAVLLGRPNSQAASPSEVNRLLDESDGIGMSALADFPFDYLKRIADVAHARGKLFSIHFSEGVRESVEDALALRPDFVVHATKAMQEDLAALADARVPVVACPRSNEFFGNEVDIPQMLSSGVEVALGTDNGMMCKPDMIEELKAAFRISIARGGISAAAAVRMATTQGRKILKADGNTTPAAEKHDFTVVRVGGKDPLKDLVTTVSARDVLAVVSGGNVRRLADWR